MRMLSEFRFFFFFLFLATATCAGASPAGEYVASALDGVIVLLRVEKNRVTYVLPETEYKGVATSHPTRVYHGTDIMTDESGSARIQFLEIGDCWHESVVEASTMTTVVPDEYETLLLVHEGAVVSCHFTKPEDFSEVYVEGYGTIDVESTLIVIRVDRDAITIALYSGNARFFPASDERMEVGIKQDQQIRIPFDPGTGYSFTPVISLTDESPIFGLVEDASVNGQSGIDSSAESIEAPLDDVQPAVP